MVEPAGQMNPAEHALLHVEVDRPVELPNLSSTQQGRGGCMGRWGR